MAEERNEFLDKLLLRLAQAYEEGKGGGVGLVNPTQVEKELTAELKAEGSVTERGLTLWFTDKGYAKYKDKIAALRAFPK
jgi:hypothetical protein